MSGSSRARTVGGREHEVTLSVSFVQSVDPPEREPQFYESMRDGQRKRIYESLNPGHHFHLEYCPLPGEGGGKVYHTDVVTFGVASKVYTDQDVRVVRCWGEKEEEEGEEEGKEEEERLVRFGWRHRHTFKVTRPLLLKLYDHVMEVRVWNTKDKLSARAQYDRPKAFRLPAPSKRPQQGEEDPPANDQPARLPVVSQDHLRTSKRGRRGRRKSNLNVATAETDSDDLNASIGEVASPLVSPRKAPTIVEEGEVEEGREEGGGGGRAEGVKEEGDTSSLSAALIPHPDHAPPTSSMEHATTLLSTTLQGLSRRKVRRLEAEAAEQARIAREGVAVLRLRMSDLFAKRTFISAAIEQAVKDLKGFEVTVSLEGPLMPEYLLRELNPMTITVNSASGLPSIPIPHQELSERCEPVYVKYHFFFQPWHHTSALPHSPLISWEDSHIILLGTIEQELLVEYLRGPPLVMEVHDRDCRQGGLPLPSLFGREERDEVLGTHAFGTGLPKKSCGSDGWSRDPCGIARVDLSGLLDGQRMIEVTVPITNSSSLGGEEEEGVSVGPLGGVLLDPLPPGDYIQSQSELTVTVELTYALTTSLPSPSLTFHSTPTKKPEPQQHTPKPSVCPFNRLVYVISSEGKSLVERILTLVNEINTRALGLQDLPSNVLPAALSTYKLTKDQMRSVGCDVITGFHVEDWEQHVVVLEGVRGGGVRRVWEELPHHQSQAEGLLKVFYNSDFAFSHRLYGSLDVDLPRVLLYQPLHELLQQSVLYVRGSIPRRCFCALVRLSELAVVSEMGELTRNELFPTAEEVVALGLQFAVPLTFEMEEECIASPLECSLERPRTPPLEERHRCHRGSKQAWEPLDLSNLVFERVLRERGRAPAQDFIRRNILHSQALSEWTAQRRAQKRTRSLSEGAQRTRSLSEGALSHKKQLESPLHPVHNYSTQTLNSTELAKAMLREKLGKDPAHRHTYCQHYHSMTVVPIDVEAERRAKRIEARRRWRTEEGFVYPGVPTSAESSAHPKKPDLVRIQDLKEPFKDNLLHANTLKPTVDRLHFSWQNRSGDFERWKPPPTTLGVAPPPTIHLAGESRARELRQSQKREKEEWRRRLVVTDTYFHIHRKGISTELHTSGPKASTQMDKLGGLLKDAPQKHSLREDRLRLDSVPALDVVHNPSVDSRLNMLCVEGEKEECVGVGGAYLPGPFNTRSLKLDSNVIPVHAQRGSQLNKRGDSTHRKLHAQDFRLYYHTPMVASKRPILPLREDEKALPLSQQRPTFPSH